MAAEHSPRCSQRASRTSRNSIQSTPFSILHTPSSHSTLARRPSPPLATTGHWHHFQQSLPQLPPLVLGYLYPPSTPAPHTLSAGVSLSNQICNVLLPRILISSSVPVLPPSSPRLPPFPSTWDTHSTYRFSSATLLKVMLAGQPTKPRGGISQGGSMAIKRTGLSESRPRAASASASDRGGIGKKQTKKQTPGDEAAGAAAATVEPPQHSEVQEPKPEPVAAASKDPPAPALAPIQPDNIGECEGFGSSDSDEDNTEDVEVPLVPNDAYSSVPTPVAEPEYATASADPSPSEDPVYAMAKASKTPAEEVRLPPSL